MSSRLWYRFICFLLCRHLAYGATDLWVTSTVSPSPTSSGSLSTETSTHSVGSDTDESTTVGTTEAAFLDFTLDPMVTTTMAESEAPTDEPETRFPTTSTPVLMPHECLCDLTPDFCDIGCCCDTLDCSIANLSTIFTGCPQKAISGVCIEKWLMFRANVDSSLVTVTDLLFCVRPQEETPQSVPALPQFPELEDSYHFSPPAPLRSSYSRDFYRADDVIQTYLNSSSMRGLLRQPSPGAAANFCVNRNPAKFLRSVSLSCTRTLTPESCFTDPTLNAIFYFSDLSLIKIPIIESAQVSDFLVPVTPLAEWPAPRKQNNSCINVVKKVEFIIGYTGRGELTHATVNIILTEVDPDQLLLQTHSVYFKLIAISPNPVTVIPAVGLPIGSPVVGDFNEEVKPLTTLELPRGGECSADPSTRAPILFTHNSITGCIFRSPASDCSELRSQIYGVLQGLSTPDLIAMNSGSQPNWAKVITQECPVSLQETCESGCFLPSSLSIQVLWARQGLLHLPQNYILGAKYIFHCQNIKCPQLSALALTTEVTFVDTTIYPEAPLGLPQPNWKFPFGFFTRGSAELDEHITHSSSDRVTQSLMLLTVTLQTGLEFFFFR